MGRVVIIALAVAALGYVGLCAALFVFQRSFLYFPQPRSLALGATTLTLDVPGASLAVTTRLAEGGRALLYFGGNAEDVSLGLPLLSAAFPGHALYLMHYRGFGGSSGKPSEAALFADALALFDTVHAQHESITVLGRSLGSGVAVYLASVRPVARLVLVTPFDSVQELAARHFRYFPVRWFLKDKFESWRYAKAVAAPTVVIAAEHDEVIPRASTETLFARFPSGTASLEVVAGANHNSISESPEYVRLLQGPP